MPEDNTVKISGTIGNASRTFSLRTETDDATLQRLKELPGVESATRTRYSYTLSIGAAFTWQEMTEKIAGILNCSDLQYEFGK
jgi:hypothetical protein